MAVPAEPGRCLVSQWARSNGAEWDVVSCLNQTYKCSRVCGKGHTMEQPGTTAHSSHSDQLPPGNSRHCHSCRGTGTAFRCVSSCGYELCAACAAEPSPAALDMRRWILSQPGMREVMALAPSNVGSFVAARAPGDLPEWAHGHFGGGADAG